jgi:hypothetical protein
MLAWQASQTTRVLRRRVAMICAHSGCGFPGLFHGGHSIPFRRSALRIPPGSRMSSHLCPFALYVALRTMLRMGSGARRASDCLRAERALCGRRRFRSLIRERNIFWAGLPPRLSRWCSATSRSTRRTCASRPAPTELKRCVLGRIGPANRQARPLAGRASLLASSRAFNPPKLCCAGKPDPPQQPPHSTVGNIVLSAT